MRLPSLLQHRINTFHDGVYASWKRYRELSQHIPIRGGFFVEAGANNGIKQSNTYGLERRAGWSGILVEAIPRLADECRSKRKAQVHEAALVSSDFEGSSIKIIDCDLMSFVSGSVGTPEDEAKLIDRACKVQAISATEVDVPALTLTSVLESHGVKNVDLLSLDVEGYEPQVLRGLDRDRFRPAFMLIENGDRPEIIELLRDYQRVTQFSNGDVLYRAT